MKINKLYKLFLALFVGSIALNSCDKDDDPMDPVETPKVTTSSLQMHFHGEVDGNHFALNQDYKMVIGSDTITYNITRSAFYISGITLSKMAGGTVEAVDRYLYVTPEEEHYTIGDIPVEHYNKVSFNVGVDSTANHTDPSTYAAEHALSAKSPSMNWTWNPGYIFMALEGEYKATDNSSGTFVFHIGLDDLLRNINLDLMPHLMPEAGKPSVIHMTVDYAELIGAVDLRTENFSKSMTPEHFEIAKKIADKIPSAITLE